MALKSRNARRYRGVALIEFALILPILLALVFGVIHYGWIILKMTQVNNAARNGARIAATRVVGARSMAEDAIDQMMADANITGYSVEIDPSDSDGMSALSVLTVTIAVPYDETDMELFDFPFLPSPDELEGTIKMVKESS